ncbi:VWA domain-containing protein [Mesorhizobium sp. 1B3]|uniref:VWA domain-containing protein n=1 Tax=Mesorhizobium sp. 1B3 TaxID=3243599 RepID=UPI003D9A03F5
MIAFGETAILRPYWLAAAVLAAALIFLWRDRGGIGDWAKAIDPHLLAWLQRHGYFREPASKGVALLSPWLLAACIVCAALSGPAVRKPAADSFRNLEGVIFALDVSRSMTQGRAIGQAAAAALQVAEEIDPSRQISIVLYAGDAYAATVLSSDRSFLQPVLTGNLAGIVVEGGSRPARAFDEIGKIFADSAMIAGDVVFFTDGGGVDDDTLAAATALQAAGHRVHAVLVDAPADGAPGADGDVTRRLAFAGGGVFAENSELEGLIRTLNSALPLRLERAGYGALIWEDLGRYMLLLAALPMLRLFGRRA